MKTGVGGSKMKKENLLDYLDQAIEKTITDYDVALDWDTKNHTIEIIVRLFAENKAHFEIDEADYLAVIPYEGKKGLKKSVVDALIEYLNEVLAEGQSDLLDFLDTDDETAVFELTFDNQKLAELVEEKQQNQSDAYLPYPSY